MYGHILLTTEMYYRGSLNMDTILRISAACWWSPVTTDLLNHNVFLCILTARLQHYKSNIQTWSICAMHAYIWTQQTGMLCMTWELPGGAHECKGMQLKSAHTGKSITRALTNMTVPHYHTGEQGEISCLNSQDCQHELKYNLRSKSQFGFTAICMKLVSV